MQILPASRIVDSENICILIGNESAKLPSEKLLTLYTHTHQYCMLTSFVTKEELSFFSYGLIGIINLFWILCIYGRHFLSVSFL